MGSAFSDAADGFTRRLKPALPYQRINPRTTFHKGQTEGQQSKLT